MRYVNFSLITFRDLLNVNFPHSVIIEHQQCHILIGGFMPILGDASAAEFAPSSSDTYLEDEEFRAGYPFSPEKDIEIDGTKFAVRRANPSNSLSLDRWESDDDQSTSGNNNFGSQNAENGKCSELIPVIEPTGRMSSVIILAECGSL